MIPTDGSPEETWDEILAMPAPDAQWGALARRYERCRGQLWLVVVPDMAHLIARMASGGEQAIRVAFIVPDMPDEARRDIGVALRGGQVDLLFVTAERFEQLRFVQFMAELKPAALLIASAQRGLPGATDVWPPYAVLPTLRECIPGVRILALVDPGAPSDALAPWLNLRAAPPVTEAVALPAAPPPRPVVKPPPTPKTTPWDGAFPHFDAESALEAVGEHLGRDHPWCVEALVHYIRKTGRSHPFPWVDRPVYLAVAMAAGQTESTEPRIVLSVLGDTIPADDVRIALAALENRSTSRPKRVPSDG